MDSESAPTSDSDPILYDTHSTPALPCIRCGRALENVFPEAQNQPLGALAFTSPGAYGSTAFDPGEVEPSFLEINVCDACIMIAQQAGAVLYGHRQPPPPPRLQLWDGHSPD